MSFTDILARADRWRDKQTGSDRGCVTLLIYGLGLFSFARLVGGAMGDHGEFTAAQQAKYDQEMHLWFATAWGGLAVAFVLGRWWRRRS